VRPDHPNKQTFVARIVAEWLSALRRRPGCGMSLLSSRPHRLAAEIVRPSATAGSMR